MNYFHLYKQAAPKNIINKYKVQDPILKLLITKFEKDIDQKQIDEYVKQGNTGEQAFDQFVIDNLLSNIIDNLDLDKKDSPYFLTKEQTRKILEDQARRGANFADHVQQQQAEQGIRYFRQNPEQATAFMMQKVNQSKAKCFKEWIDYLSETELYQENPAFSYMILRSIANKTEGRTDDPLPLNSEALPQVFEKMKDGKDLDIFETYKHFGNQADVKSLSIQKVDGENGWIKIPSKINDPQNFEENVKKLVSLSTGNGWCTASVMADPYLSRGDFWMYIENGRAAVAVRFDGNSVAEIQGRNNQRPFNYWNVIEKLFADNNFDKNSLHYKELLQVKVNNERMESDPNFKKQFIELCIHNFRNLQKIDEKYIDDDMIQKLSPSFIDKIRDRVVFIHQLPRKMQNNQEIRSVQKSVYLEILPMDPNYYQQAIDSFPNDEDIYELGKQVYLRLVKSNPAYYYPEAIKLFASDEEEFNEAYKQGWLQLIKYNPDIYYEKALILFPNDKDIYELGKQGYLQIVKREPIYYQKAIELFPNEKVLFYEVGKQGYLQLVKREPTYYEQAIKLFPNHKEEFYKLGKQGWFDLVARDADEYYQKAIKLFPNDREFFANALQKFRVKELQRYPLQDLEMDDSLFINPVYNNARRQGFLKVFADITFVQLHGQKLFDCIIKSRKLYPNDAEIYNASKESALRILKPPHYNFADPSILHVFPNDDDIFEKFMKLYESYLTITHDSNKTKAEYIKELARDLHLLPISRQSDVFTRINEFLDKLSDQKPKQACGWYTLAKYSNLTIEMSYSNFIKTAQLELFLQQKGLSDLFIAQVKTLPKHVQKHIGYLVNQNPNITQQEIETIISDRQSLAAPLQIEDPFEKIFQNQPIDQKTFWSQIPKEFVAFTKKILLSHEVKPEDITLILETFTEFTALKNSAIPIHKDINSYKTFSDLSHTIERFSLQSDSEAYLRVDPRKLSGVSWFQSGPYTVYKVTDATSLSEMGTGTKWCTRKNYKINGKDACRAADYLADHDEIYVVTRGAELLYQFTPNFGEFQDIQNRKEEKPADLDLDQIVVESLEKFTSTAFDAIGYASMELRNDKKFMERMIRKYGALMYAHVGHILSRDKDLALQVLDTDATLLEYVHYELSSDKDFLLEAVTRNGEIVNYMNDYFHDDKDIFLAAVYKTPEAIEECSAELKKDINFLKEALTINPFSFFHMNNAAKCNRELFEFALKLEPHVFQSGCEKLRAEKDLVILGIKGDSLAYTSEELQDDKDFVLQTVKIEPYIWLEASERLQEDFDVAKAAIDTDYRCYASASARSKLNTDIAAYFAFISRSTNGIPLEVKTRDEFWDKLDAFKQADATKNLQ